MDVNLQKHSRAQADCCGAWFSHWLQVWSKESATVPRRAACHGPFQVWPTYCHSATYELAQQVTDSHSSLLSPFLVHFCICIPSVLKRCLLGENRFLFLNFGVCVMCVFIICFDWLWSSWLLPGCKWQSTWLKAFVTSTHLDLFIVTLNSTMFL